MIPDQQRPKPQRLRRFLTLSIVVLIAVSAALSSQAASLPEEIAAPVAGLDAARDVALARLGETPATTPQPWPGELVLCEPLSDARLRALQDAVALMRSTETGRELHDMLQREGVCIGFEDLAYNSAYASSRWSFRNGWADSEIRVDPSYATFLYPDVLAAILVHEATHIQRAVDRTACYYAETCTILDNGVYLDEEIVAHSAEAEFWIELFGRDGKDRAFASDTAENQLKSHYLQGPDAFGDFVAQMRSDHREGEGL